MSMLTKAAAIVLAIGAVAALPQSARAATLAPGVYFGTAAITSEVGFLCSFVPLPESVQFSMIYPGPSATGGNLELLVPGSGSFQAYGVTFPTTPAAGITSWTGTVSATIPGQGTLGGSVVINGVPADASSVTATISLNVGPGYCTIGIGIEGSRVGHL